MFFPKKILFFVLFLFKELASAERYNLTKELNATIVDLFQSIDPETASNFIKSVLNLESTLEYTFNWTDNTGKMESMTLNHLELIRVFDSGENKSHMSYAFDDNKIEIFSPHLLIKLEGHRQIPIETRSKSNFMKFKCAMDLSNYSIYVFDQANRTFHVHYHVDSLNIDDVVARSAVVSTQKSEKFVQLFEICPVEQAKQTSVLQHMKQYIVSVSTRNINRDDRIVRKLTETCRDQPARSLSSRCARFQRHHQTYYLIPSVSFTKYHFQNITIEGLTNFESFTITEQPLKYTLVIRNVRGSLIMDVEDENVSPDRNSVLDFIIGSLSISIEPNNNAARVGAANYSIVVAKTKASFDLLQSTVVMGILEGAIESSIFPSMTSQRTTKCTSEPDTEVTTMERERITIEGSSQMSDESTKSTQSTYHTEDRSTNHSKENPTETTKTSCRDEKACLSTCDTAEDRLKYQVEFDNANIKMISRDRQDSEQIHCELLNKFRFTHLIKAMLLDRCKPDCVELQAKVGFVNFSVIEPNSTITEADGSYEFQVCLNQNIRVRVMPSKGGKNVPCDMVTKLLKIKKKIDIILLPLAQTLVVQQMMPITHKLINVCWQSTKLLTIYFQRLFDDLLTKLPYRVNEIS